MQREDRETQGRYDLTDRIGYWDVCTIVESS